MRKKWRLANSAQGYLHIIWKYMHKVILTSSMFRKISKTTLFCSSVFMRWCALWPHTSVQCLGIAGGFLLAWSLFCIKRITQDCIRLHCLEIFVERTSWGWSSLETSLWSAVFASRWTVLLLISFTVSTYSYLYCLMMFLRVNLYGSIIHLPWLPLFYTLSLDRYSFSSIRIF